MAVCNECPYYPDCGDYAGDAFEGSGKEIVNCIKDLEEHGAITEKERYMMKKANNIERLLKAIHKELKAIRKEVK